MLKIKAFENNEEKIISIDSVLDRKIKAREIFEIDTALNNLRTIVLQNLPIVLSEFVFVNGLLYADGSNYDYTLNANEIIFNVGILPKKGHILINYEYLN